MNDTPHEWDQVYLGAPPWDIGRPQPACVELAERGSLAGELLDVGCGTGENTLLAASFGAAATGVDISPRAIEKARAKAEQRGIEASFEVADALRLLDLDRQFDVVLDVGLFHSFDDAERQEYVAQLADILRPGGAYHTLVFSDATPGNWGPRRVSRADFDAVFTAGWTIKSVQPTVLEINPGMPVQQPHAWLATISRH